MRNEDIISTLNDLLQLDVDAVHAYEQAIDNIDDQQVAARISEFRDDHERHIRDLGDAVTMLGGTPVEPSRDVKGFFIEGFTAIRSATGTEGALEAMRTNEVLTNNKYDKALEDELPEQVRSLVERNRDDERRHLQYIDDVLAGREPRIATEPTVQP